MAIDFNKSGAKFSSIVGIGETIRQLSAETGEEYLMLNRGVNAVTNIDLQELQSDPSISANISFFFPMHRRAMARLIMKYLRASSFDISFRGNAKANLKTFSASFHSSRSNKGNPISPRSEESASTSFLGKSRRTAP